MTLNLTGPLTQLENAGLVRLAAAAPDLAYAFRHGLIQDAAYSTLLRAQRQVWHLAAAEVLEADFETHGQMAPPDPGAVEALAPILAHHFALAGDRARALKYLIRSAEAAFNRYANLEAIEFYSRALAISAEPAGQAADLPLLGHLFGRLGRALELTSQFEAALANYERQEALARAVNDPALELASLMARATIHSTANFARDEAQAAALLERARGLAQASGDQAAEANLSWTLMLNNTMSGGDVEERIRLGERALLLAQALDQRELLAFIYNDLWFAYGGAGQWDQALGSLRAGEVIARQLGNLSVLCENLGRTAMTHMLLGDYSAALAHIDQAYALAEAANSADFRGLSQAFTGLIHMDRGDLGRAINISEAALAWGEVSGNVTVLIGTRADLARAYALLGALERALPLAQQASQGGFDLLSPWPQSVLVRLHLMRGEVAEAVAAQMAAGDYREVQRRASFIPTMWGNLALTNIEVLLAQRNFDSARAEAEELIERFGACRICFLMPEARLGLARALLGLGQPAEARSMLETARLEAEALGSRRLLWPILAALADAATQAGAAETAAEYRQAELEVVQYIAAHAPEGDLRRSFLALPAVSALTHPA